jgi:hypothetical protein
MAIDFLEGLASTVNDALNPLFDLASKTLHFFFPPKVEHTTSLDSVEPFR